MNKWSLGIYVVVTVILSLLSGLVLGREPKKDRDGDENDMFMWVVWLWPIVCSIGVVTSPIWVPIVLRNFTWWIKEKWNKRRIINNLLTSVAKKNPK